MRIRIFPVVIIGALGLLGVKMTDLVMDFGPVVPGVGKAMAQEGPGRVRQKQLDKRGNMKKTDAELKAAGNARKDAVAGKRDTRFGGGLDLTRRQDTGLPSEGEVALLKSLSKRRIEIEKRERELRLREKLMQAAEAKIEKRIKLLKALEEKRILAQKKKQEEEKNRYRNLVSLYENMKPKAAARIFNSLDLNVLIGVAKSMKARKMAAVLAKMDAKVAGRLTVEMARRKKDKKAKPTPASSPDDPELLPKIGS